MIVSILSPSGQVSLMSCPGQLHSISLAIAATDLSISVRSARQANSPEHATKGAEVSIVTREPAPNPPPFEGRVKRWRAGSGRSGFAAPSPLDSPARGRPYGEVASICCHAPIPLHRLLDRSGLCSHRGRSCPGPDARWHESRRTSSHARDDGHARDVYPSRIRPGPCRPRP